MKKILFLDRDGIINIDKHYLYKISDVVFVDGIFALCKYFQSHNFEIVIITNQSGIAQGLYSVNEFHITMTYILREFKEQGIDVLGYLYCPHKSSDKCDCRKPLPGLFKKVIRQYNVLAENCVSIGDRESDVIAAITAGIAQNYILVNEIMGDIPIQGAVIVKSLAEIIETHQSFTLKSQK